MIFFYGEPCRYVIIIFLLFQVLMSIKRVECMHVCVCVCVSVYTYMYIQTYICAYVCIRLDDYMCSMIITLLILFFSLYKCDYVNCSRLTYSFLIYHSFGKIIYISAFIIYTFSIIYPHCYFYKRSNKMF